MLVDCTADTPADNFYDAGCPEGSSYVIDVGTPDWPWVVVVTVGVADGDGNLPVSMSTSQERAYLADAAALQGITKKSMQSPNSVTMVTPPVSPLATQNPAGVFANQALGVYLLAKWKDEEVYSACESNACEFTFRADHTPIVRVDAAASSLFLASQPLFEASAGTTALTVGDTLVLSYDTAADSAGTNFNWGAVSAADLSLVLNNATLDFDLAVVETPAAAGGDNTSATHAVTLTARVGGEVAPCRRCEVRLFASPYGNGVVLGDHLEVLPVVYSVSHRTGSSLGGLDLVVRGKGLVVAPGARAAVTVGGRPCAGLRANGTDELRCTTTGGEVVPKGFGAVEVSIFGTPAVCLEAAAAAATSGNATRPGCAFQYSTNTTHTPRVDGFSKRFGRAGETVTITGAGFAGAGNVVTMGLAQAEVVAEGPASIEVAVPRHVGGTYRVTVAHPDLGLADGERLWFRFESGVTDLAPRLGSRYGGQRVTLTGFGFAPAGGGGGGGGAPSAEEAAYAALFGDWVNIASANGTAAFGLDVEWATFDTLVGTTQFRGYRAVEGDFSAEGLRGLSVNTARAGEGLVRAGGAAHVAVTGGGPAAHIFDGDPATTFDGYGGGKNLQIYYYAYRPFLLTDYQVRPSVGCAQEGES